MESFVANMTTTMAPNGTTPAVPPDTIPLYWGFVAAAVAVVFFGSNFVPIKKFETGDGMFFQWVLCAAIWFSGLIVQAITGFPTFYPLAMLGGFLWCVGNTMVVPIIKTIGLSQGILIWGSFNLMMGWASGRFGFFGIDQEVPPKQALNYVGIALCLLSAVFYIFIKSNADLHVASAGDDQPGPSNSEDNDLLLPKVHVQSTNSSSSTVVVAPEEGFLDRLSPLARRILGSTLAVISGILYGANFIPVIYIQNNYKGASQNGLDYVFSHFSGIFSTSTILFMCYCVYRRNAPKVYPRVILPGFVSGIMWAIADSAWFVANSALSEPVSFPIITAGPGIVASLWGVFLFKEIRGWRNLVLLVLAFALTIAGTIITGFSKG